MSRLILCVTFGLVFLCIAAARAQQPSSPAGLSSWRIARSFELNGRDDCVSIADHPSLRPARFTLLASVRVAELGRQQPILAKCEASGNWCSYMLRLEADGRLSLAVENRSQERAVHWLTRKALAAGQWHHLAATWENRRGDASDARIYIKGEPCEIDIVLNRGYGPDFRPGYNAEPLYLGRDQFPSGHFGGVLREVDILSGVLGEREVSELARLALRK